MYAVVIFVDAVKSWKVSINIHLSTNKLREYGKIPFIYLIHREKPEEFQFSS